MFRRILGALSVRLVFQRAIVLRNLEFGMKIVAKVPLVIRNTRSGATVREEPALPFRVPIHQIFVGIGDAGLRDCDYRAGDGIHSGDLLE